MIVDKSKLAAGSSIRKSHCAIVGGFHHCAVKKVFDGAGFAFGDELPLLLKAPIRTND